MRRYAAVIAVLMVLVPGASAGPEDVLDAAESSVRDAKGIVDVEATPAPTGTRKLYGRTAAGLLQVGPHAWHIPQAVYDSHMTDFETLAGLASYRQQRDERGVVVGYRLSDIDREGVLRQAGIHNGDVIRRVDGVPMTSLPAVLKAHRGAKRAERVTVELTRRNGKRLTLTYTVE